MSYGIHLACQRLDELGDPLSGLKSLIDWEEFGPILEGIYDNRTEKGGHPNYDEVLMIKILVLQHWYSLSDQKMELEMAKNISFMRFLDFQEDIPDSTPIWLFKERLKEKEVLNAIWQELQRQLDAKGLSVKEGCIQDATLITSDPGRSGIRNEVMKLKLVGAKMVPGPKRARRSISGTNFTAKWMLGMGWFELSRPLQLQYTIAR